MGWQRQTSGRTVQGVLESAVAKVTSEEVPIAGAGRTDSGVHATGQVAHFDTAWIGSNKELFRALNAVLPRDVAIRSLVVAPPGFHARHSAERRVYRYSIWNGLVRSPLDRRTSFAVREALDEERMNRAAEHLIGVRDFGGFGRPMTSGGPTVRKMVRLDIARDGNMIAVVLEANAFLRHQVRRTVGFLIDVGRARHEPEHALALLAGTANGRAAWRTPARGLVLEDVHYPSEESIATAAARADRLARRDVENGR